MNTPRTSEKHADVYKQVLIEISGRCNAKCKWCVTGIKNNRNPESMPSMKKNIMDIITFKKIVNHLLKEKIVDHDTLFILYNWGEPFLNPDLYEIFVFMYENDLTYFLSTNVSIELKELQHGKLFNNLKGIRLSYSGFSQQSYDRIHQFNFEKIKLNTRNMLRILRQNGFQGEAIMAYHIYQFNQGLELLAAKRFCEDLDITFLPSYAFINDFREALRYLKDELEYDTLKEMGKELCFHYVDGLIKKRPKSFHCPLMDSLDINENGELLPCCAIDDRPLGKILDYGKSDIANKKKNMNFCEECRNSGFDYWVTNPLVPEMEKKKLLEVFEQKITQFGDKEFILFGAGKDGRYMANFLRTRKGKIRCFIDNNIEKYGAVVDGIDVKSPEELCHVSDISLILITSQRYKNQIKNVLLAMGKKENEDFYYFEDILEQYLIENMK